VVATRFRVGGLWEPHARLTTRVSAETRIHQPHGRSEGEGTPVNGGISIRRA
jgi:hypothetical protein